MSKKALVVRVSNDVGDGMGLANRNYTLCTSNFGAGVSARGHREYHYCYCGDSIRARNARTQSRNACKESNPRSPGSDS
jgi:hypothetical protein